MPVNKDYYMLTGSSGQSTGYEIDQSIRFNDNDSAYMSRTPGSAGDRRTWTWSGWVKRGDLSTYSAGRIFLQHGDSGSGLQEVIRIDSAATNQYLMYYSDPDSGYVRTTYSVNDPSAWYHFIFVKDTTHAVNSERFRIYINGIRQTSLQNSTYPSQNSQGYINNTVLHRIGADQNGSSSNYDGYLAEVHFLDSYAYGPEFFGEFKQNTDIWIPKEYTGSYGTNGFYLKGESSGALGNDSSGNDNDYSTNGLAADDQQPDSPTNNHAVFNPLDVASNGFTTFSEGNLAITYSGSTARELARSSITIPADTDGFFEMKITADLGSGVDFAIGIEDGSALQDASNTTYTNGYIIREDGTFSTTGSSSTSSYGTSFDQNDVIGVWRKANGDLVFYKNGTAMNSGTPAVTSVTGEMHFVAGGFNGGAGLARFASSKWTDTPTGVSSTMALNTKNLGS